MAEKRSIEYICTYCGKKTLKNKSLGRPDPGTCQRRGKNMPHRWVKNREL